MKKKYYHYKHCGGRNFLYKGFARCTISILRNGWDYRK